MKRRLRTIYARLAAVSDTGVRQEKDLDKDTMQAESEHLWDIDR